MLAKVQKNLIGLELLTSKNNENVLKNYYAWLKSQKIKKFNLSDPETSLHFDLELVEHFLLITEDSVLPNDTREKLDWMRTQLEFKKLISLFYWIKDYRQKTEDLSHEEKFVASLLLALFSDQLPTLIDLRFAEKFIKNQMLIKQVCEVILEQSKSRHITLVCSHESEWHKLFADHLINQERLLAG